MVRHISILISYRTSTMVLSTRLFGIFSTTQHKRRRLSVSAAKCRPLADLCEHIWPSLSFLSAANPALNSGIEPLFSSPPLGCSNANSPVSFAYEQTIQGLRLLTFSNCIEIQPVAFSPSAEFSFKCVSRLEVAQTHRSQTNIPGAAWLLKT